MGLTGASRGSAARPRLRRLGQLPGSRPCVPRLQQPRRSRRFDGSSLPGVGASPTPQSRRQPRHRPDRPTDQQPSHPTYGRGYDAPRPESHHRQKNHRRENHRRGKHRQRESHRWEKHRWRESHRLAESRRGENRRHQPNRRHAWSRVQPGPDRVGRNLGWVVRRCRNALWMRPCPRPGAFAPRPGVPRGEGTEPPGQHHRRCCRALRDCRRERRCGRPGRRESCRARRDSSRAWTHEQLGRGCCRARRDCCRARRRGRSACRERCHGQRPRGRSSRYGQPGRAVGRQQLAATSGMCLGWGAGRRCRTARLSLGPGAFAPGLGVLRGVGTGPWGQRRRLGAGGRCRPRGVDQKSTSTSAVAASSAGWSSVGPMPIFSLIFFSSSLARSGLSRRKFRAFSRPWPSWSLS